MRHIPAPGDKYRHFKNKWYQIVALAKHSETEEEMVVYQALYGDFGVWVRPLSLFMEKVDRAKYPEAAQEYRFAWQEEIAAGEGAASFSESTAGEREKPQPIRAERGEEPMHPLLLAFLETDSAADRLAILQKMKGRVGQREVDSLCFCLDVKPMEGEIGLQLENLKKIIQMQQYYDGPRLRRGK